MLNKSENLTRRKFSTPTPCSFGLLSVFLLSDWLQPKVESHLALGKNTNGIGPALASVSCKNLEKDGDC